MKAEIADKWVSALRSGEYEQCTEQLYNSDSNSYCCLGVLCKIASDDGIIAREEDGCFTLSENDSGDEYLPISVMEWAGIGSPGGSLSGVGIENDGDGGIIETTEANYLLRTYLYDLNDTEHLNFNQIANVIEKYKDKL